MNERARVILTCAVIAAALASAGCDNPTGPGLEVREGCNAYSGQYRSQTPPGEVFTATMTVCLGKDVDPRVVPNACHLQIRVGDKRADYVIGTCELIKEN